MSVSVSELAIPQIGEKARERVEETPREMGAVKPYELVNLHRDERDVRLLLHLSVSQLVVIGLLFISLAFNLYLALRKPDQIVIDRRADGDHVVSYNGQAVNQGVSYGPDKPGDGDKRRLASEWALARYAIDPDPRKREEALERLLKMMEPTSAQKFVAFLKRRGELERESAERWQTVWTPQLVTVDVTNPYRINIVGTQEVNKSVGGVPQKETRQIVLSLQLMADRDSGRAAHNLHTGFLVRDIYDIREVTGGNADQSLLTQPQQ